MAPTTDRATLTTLLAEARQEQPGAFLAALRDETDGLDLDERDEQFLRWLAGWDADTVAGVVRLLRLARSSATSTDVEPSDVLARIRQGSANSTLVETDDGS